MRALAIYQRGCTLLMGNVAPLPAESSTLDERLCASRSDQKVRPTVPSEHPFSDPQSALTVTDAMDWLGPRPGPIFAEMMNVAEMMSGHNKQHCGAVKTAAGLLLNITPERGG